MMGRGVVGSFGRRALLCLLVPLVVGCASGVVGQPGRVPSQPMDSTRIDGAWALSEINGAPMKGTRAELVFNAARSEVHGSDGCNRLMGRFTLENGRLTTKTASTRMACSFEPVASVSRTLGVLLVEGAEAVEVNRPAGSALLLRSGTESALFERRPAP